LALPVGEDKAKLKTEGLKTISQLATKDDKLKTNPGPSPVVELAGESDPVATKTAELQAKQKSEEELEKQRDKILAGPGPAQVQPLKVEEKLKVSTGDLQVGPMPTLPPVNDMALFKNWKSTADASLKSGFDEIARPKLDAAVQPAKDKLMQSADERDQSRQKLIAEAQQKTAQANAEAQSKQAQEVAGARSKIAAEQQNTLAKQKAAVADVESKANTKRAATMQKIDARVQADQQQIQSQYKDAQKQSEEEQQRGQQEAQEKREEAERQASQGSWWDRAVNAVTSAISAVAHAIDGVLQAVASAVGRIIDAVKNAACAIIDAARNFIVAAIGEFGSWLQEIVSATIGQIFPELASALNRAIDGAVRAAQAAVNAIADGLKRAVTALLDGLKAGINAAINAYRAAVQAAATFATALVTGDWALVGKMLLEAALSLCGIDKAQFYALIGEARETIHLILDDPGAFAGHVIDAVKQGFSQFGSNFLTHLRDGIVQWLFGTFAEAGIRIPARFDIGGVFDLVCQVLGLTYPRLRQKAVRLIGEQNVSRIEFVWGYVQELLTHGWAGVWERVQNDLGNLWSTVIDGAKSWLLQRVVQTAIVRLATMFNPVGALVNLLMTAWNVYQWVKENAQRLFGLVQAVVHSMTEIAHGNIQNAANFIENSLARLVPVAISLLANLLGLGGIADRIREIIERIQGAVDTALDRLIERVMAMFRGGGDKKKDKKKIDHLGNPATFTAAGHGHKVWVKVDADGKTPVEMIASDPIPIAEQARQMRREWEHMPAGPDKDAGAQKLEPILTIQRQLHTAATTALAAPDPTAAAGPIQTPQQQLATAMQAAFEFFAQHSDVDAPLKLAATDIDLKTIETELSMKLYHLDIGGTVVSGASDAKQDAYRVRTMHPTNSAWDRTTKKLTLPPVQKGPLTSATSLSGLGDAIKQETGAGNVTSFREGENVKDQLILKATVGQTAVIAHGKLGVDRRLKDAVGSNLIQFLHNMGVNGSHGGLTLAQLTMLCDNDQGGGINFNWLKNKFRDVSPYSGTYHEWIPSNLIVDVLNYVRSRQSAPDAAKAAKLIDMQNDFRVDTGWIIFKPSKITDEKEGPGPGGTKRMYTVFCGHTGAVKKGRSSSTKGQPEFHEALRKACAPNFANPGAMIDEIKKVFDEWVWHGFVGPVQQYNPPLHPEYTDKLGRIIVDNHGQVAATQLDNYIKMIAKFDEFKTKYGT
jgi:phage-related protein